MRKFPSRCPIRIQRFFSHIRKDACENLKIDVKVVALVAVIEFAHILGEDGYFIEVDGVEYQLFLCKFRLTHETVLEHNAKRSCLVATQTRILKI